MKDRNVQHAIRFRLTKVPGTDDVYDLIPAPGEVYEEGTLINKSALLKDATAALFGLDENAVPDDAFAWVGRYAEHWWEKRSVNFTDSKVDISSAQPLLVAGQPLYYGNSVAYDGQKLIILNEQSIVLSSVSQTTLAQIANLAPCYVRSLATQNKVLYLPTGTTAGNSNTSTIYAPSSDVAYCSASSSVKVQDVSVSSITYGEWQTMFSANRSDYPDSGVVNGYEYRYLGVPFENLPTAPKISNGAYTGTGTYGKDNPNSLTFDFEPKIVYIAYTNDGLTTYFPSSNYKNPRNMVFPDRLTTSYENGVGFQMSNENGYGKKSSDGKTIYWYNTAAADQQFNYSGSRYYYFAIG